MMNRDFLKNLPNLTKQESLAIKNFENDENRAGFAGIADILRTRGYLEECIILLEEGLKRFPKFSSARAQLAADYFSRGLLSESLREAHRVSLEIPDHAQAHRLLLKLLVYFGKTREAEQTLSILSRITSDDSFTATMRKCLSQGDWVGAKKWVVSHLERLGVTLEDQAPSALSPQGQATQMEEGEKTESGAGPWQIPRHISTVAAGAHAKSSDTPRVPGPIITNLRESAEEAAREGTVPVLPQAFLLGNTLAHIRGDADRYLLLRSVRKQDLNSYFFYRSQDADPTHELDETTIAALYRSQGVTARRSPSEHKVEQSQNLDRSDRECLADRTGADAGKTLTSAPQNSDTMATATKIQRLRSILAVLDGQ